MVFKYSKRILLGFTSVVLALGSLAAQPLSAQADPGFCGVKGDVQAVPGGPAQVTFYYAVRNRCSRTLYFEAYDVAAPKTSSYCLPISGGATRALPMGAHKAVNWGVRICRP